jgi:glycosyltransferase involved in cell wall biosynthesis
MISGTNQEEPYGSTIRPTNIAKHLAKLGLEISHFGINHPSEAENTMLLTNYDLFQGPLMSRFTHIRKELGKSPPDLIYSHQIESAKLGLMLSFYLRVPHVYDAHSSIALESPTFVHSPIDIMWRQLFFERMIVKLSSKTIVPSKELKSFFVDRYRLNPDKIAIVKNGVDPARFFPCPPDKHLRKDLCLDEATFLVVFTNPRLPTFPSNEMALKYLFKVIPKIEEKVSPVKFLILGGGARPKPPSENVIYTGFVDDLASYLNIADVCVAPFPDQAVCGGTRTKVGEFLACGKPIVATAEGMRGFDDAVPGEHYFLASSAEEFAQLVIECFNSPGKATHVGQNASKLSEKIDWRNLSKELEKYLVEVIS